MRRRELRRDAIAGLINAVVSVPDGLASAALAGVNPVYGLYTSIAALAAGQAIESYAPQARAQAMFLLVAMTGVRAGTGLA